MAVDQSPLRDEEIARLFLDTPPVEPGSFEFALVLGGTVSAGAYTAGALDFLIQALDCFSEARAAGRAPRHRAILKLIAGTSGGGVNAGVAARALAYDFPPIARPPATTDLDSGNPFYDVWVNKLRLGGFLDTSDLGGELRSLLNGAPIDAGCRHIVEFGPGSARARDWVAGPLRLILTVTNLRGIPYKLEISPTLRQSYVDHADYLRFAVRYPGQAPGAPRPDEQALSFGGAPAPQATSWDDFALAATATAAFPLGFPARPLARPTEHYRYRVIPYPGEAPATNRAMALRPDWEAMRDDKGEVPESWTFLAVDGGATDNEPIQLARTSLAGLLNTNPRDANLANRAIWLIDPFAGRAALGPEAATSFPLELSAIVGTLIEQTRYSTADLLMAGNESIFSRFMLTPTRLDGTGRLLTGRDAIASSGLRAFIGFASPEFMRFDYMLGRRNCQAFLRENFVLGEANPLFAGWTADDRRDFRQSAGAGFLPIIPLVGAAAAETLTPAWPSGALDPEHFRAGIEARYRGIFELEVSGGPGMAAIGWAGARLTEGHVADYVIKAMNDYLEAAGLA